MVPKVRAIHKHIQSSKGVAVVEFALVLPLLIMLFGIIIDLGYMMHQYLVVDEVARAAARYAVVNKADDEVKDLVLKDRDNKGEFTIKFYPPRDTKDSPLRVEYSQVKITVSCPRIELHGLVNGLIKGVTIYELPTSITRDVFAMIE